MWVNEKLEKEEKMAQLNGSKVIPIKSEQEFNDIGDWSNELDHLPLLQRRKLLLSGKPNTTWVSQFFSWSFHFLCDYVYVFSFFNFKFRFFSFLLRGNSLCDCIRGFLFFFMIDFLYRSNVDVVVRKEYEDSQVTRRPV